MRSGLPVAVLTACGLVLLASFLPWVTVHGTPHVTSVNGVLVGSDSGVADALTEMFSHLTLTLNGWSGNVTMFGIELPTWLVPAAALFVAGHALMSLAPNTRVSRWLPLLFCGYGLLHLTVLAVWMLIPDRTGTGTLQPGWYLATFAFLLMLRSLIHDRAFTQPDAPKPAPQRAPV